MLTVIVEFRIDGRETDRPLAIFARLEGRRDLPLKNRPPLKNDTDARR